MTKVNIVGGGLTGCECAWQLAKRGIEVEIFEMRDEQRKTFAHRSKDLAELVCSNSLRSNDPNTAIGLLHAEMQKLDSLIIASGLQNRVPAGSALAVDRQGFSQFIEEKLLATKKVKITRQEITSLPSQSNEKWIIASGPLTSDLLSQEILKLTSKDHLAFFDAIAPIIFKESIDFTIAWMQSRYDKGEGSDYINCPLNKEQYIEFVNEINNCEKTEFKDWEKNTPYFDGCLPIEEMAKRGEDVLRFGPLKPVGLTNPHFEKSPPETKLKDRKEKAYAIVQLRQDNALGTLYNMVGFQTKMKYGEQQRIFRKIPGLQNAEFARFGGIHRNTFINSPQLLDGFMRLKKFPHLRFAGQITGVEGYVESASMGLLAGIFCAQEIFTAQELTEDFLPPQSTAIGALLNYITSARNCDNPDSAIAFQPMNVNFGLFLPLEQNVSKDQRKEAYKNRALEHIELWQNKILK
jgi:methylenetetrahydrofolate--tRNA-(uracil-5-)-methyltransferase